MTASMTNDELLTTTRTVRKRLDLTREVPMPGRSASSRPAQAGATAVPPQKQKSAEKSFGKIRYGEGEAILAATCLRSATK